MAKPIPNHEVPASPVNVNIDHAGTIWLDGVAVAMIKPNLPPSLHEDFVNLILSLDGVSV